MSSTTVRQVNAEEPASRFLKGLRERGLHDLALDYINKMEKSPLAPKDFKQTIGFEKGVTIVNASHAERDLTLKNKMLDEAQNTLEAFIKDNPTHALASEAETQLGNLLVSRAGMLAEQAKSKPEQADELNKQAAGLYAEALKLFTNTIAKLKQRLTEMRKINLNDPKNSALAGQRDQMRAAYVQTQLLRAVVYEEQAEIFPEGSAEWKKSLEQAIAEFEVIADKYRTMMAGLLSQLFQGRCYQKLGEHEKALDALLNLVGSEPSDPPAVRNLRQQATSLAIPSWIHEKQFQEATTYGQELASTIRPSEQRTPAWQEMQLLLSDAHWEYSLKLKADNKGKEADKQSDLAEGLALIVSKIDSVHQQGARERLVKYGRMKQDDLFQEPLNFADAKDAGKAALKAWQAAPKRAKELPALIAAEKNEEKKLELQVELAAVQEMVKAGPVKSLEFFQKALQFVKLDTPISDVNVVRYYLGYLYYLEKDLVRAGIVGDFVARKHPSDEVARHCAKIALASYVQEYIGSKSEDKSLESHLILEFGRYVATQWPDTDEGVLAASTVAPFMIKEKRLAEAEVFVNQIPEKPAKNAEKRGEAEIKLGQAYWNSYLTKLGAFGKLPADQQPAAEKVLEAEKTAAEKYLSLGIGRVKDIAEVDKRLAIAVLSLGQIYVYIDQPEKAVEVFELPRIGALTLLKEKSPATQDGGYGTEVYRTAMRAYIGALATTKEPGEVIKKANAAMQGLKGELGDSPEAQQKLTGIYQSLARGLQIQMEKSTGEQKNALAKGFRSMVEQVATGSNEFSTLNWASDTLYKMGEGLNDGSDGGATAARPYYAQATDIYTKMIDLGKKNSDFFPSPGLALQVKLGHARALSAMGQNAESIELFADILKESNAMLSVQLEAARSYQRWAEEGETEHFATAYRGSHLNEKGDKYIIWGWAQLANRTQGNAEYQDEFFEGRYNFAYCLFKEAQSQSGEEQSATMKKARTAISSMFSTYLEMGGPEWEPKFDSLFAQVQSALGEAEPHGIAAEREKMAKRGEEAKSALEGAE